MMLKQMSNKKIIIGVCAAAAVIAAVMAALLFHKEETFRSIMVYDVEGNAVIERADVGSLSAAENLYLESGDRVSVAQDSSMRMKLDDDKYVMAEADTIFSIEAEGTEADSRTKICLEQGAITHEIQRPLSDGSQYETSTPNSVMAVRGTIYRVELSQDENGEQNTKLCCFQGKVGTKPILPNGTYGEEVLVPAGSELIVYSDGAIDGPKDIAYEELPQQAVQNLISLSESGQTLTGISLDDLTELTVQTEDMSKASEKSEPEPAKETDTADVKEASQNTADISTEKDIDVFKEKNPPVKTDKKVPTSSILQMTAQQPEQNPQPAIPDTTAIKPTEQINSEAVNNAVGEDNSQEENTGNDSAGYDQGNQDKSDKDKPHKDRPDKNKPNNDKPNNDKPHEPDKDKPQWPTVYTVTFMYQDEVFATQTVVNGDTVEEPVLIPAAAGTWDFDFSTIIQADTTITWNDSIEEGH